MFMPKPPRVASACRSLDTRPIDRGQPIALVFLYSITAPTAATPSSSRHWFITDATGHIEEVHGPGVVGE
jgi:uncharacterized protein affecting Mg2+/Co2+ transport